MLAIVIPYYKLSFFEAALQSLQAQTDKRFVVYIGDDNSPEDPAALLQKYASGFKWIYKKFETNLGSKSLVRQWNRCLDMTADEQWVMILGDDDVLPPNAVAAFYENLPRIEACSVIRFATQKIDASGNPTSAIYEHPVTENAVDFLFRKSRSSLSEYIFNMTKVREIGFRDFPLAWHSDWLALLEFSNFGQVYSINQAVVSIRVSEHSISGDVKNYAQKSLASFYFYRYLLDRKQSYFSKAQRKILLKRIEKSYLYNKKKFWLFAAISRLYFKNGFAAGYFSFLKSIVLDFQKHYFAKS